MRRRFYPTDRRQHPDALRPSVGPGMLSSREKASAENNKERGNTTVHSLPSLEDVSCHFSSVPLSLPEASHTHTGHYLFDMSPSGRRSTNRYTEHTHTHTSRFSCCLFLSKINPHMTMMMMSEISPRIRSNCSSTFLCSSEVILGVWSPARRGR